MLGALFAKVPADTLIATAIVQTSAISHSLSMVYSVTIEVNPNKTIASYI